MFAPLLCAAALAFETDEALTRAPTAAAPDRPDAIIHGEDAGIEDWPQTGGLLVGGTATVSGFGELSARALMCSATLIAPDVVLTAAHCVDVEGLIDAAATQGVTVESYGELEFVYSREPYLANYDLTAGLTGPLPEWPADAAIGTTAIPHPDFDLLTLQVGLADNHDIALVFLDRATDLPFAILPTPEEAGLLAVDDPVVIVGWGQQQQDALPGTVGEKQVADSYIAAIDAFEFKVGEVYDDGRKCHGDSGGPSFREFETPSAERWRQIGVTSHAWDATTDCRVTGGVDTRVDHHLDWIDATLREGCASGARAWCLEEGVIAPPDAAGLFPWEIEALAEAEDPEGKGCGCASGPSPAAGALALGLGLLALRRRR